MKVDYKRELKHLYSAPREPSMVDVPELAFLMIDGHGDPNTAPSILQRSLPRCSRRLLKLPCGRSPS